jgi:lipid-A-disaccharide synthase
VQLSGIFNPKLGNPLYTPKDFSVMGFVDTLKIIFFALKAMREMVELANEVDKVFLIDAPAFNLPLAKKIKEKYPNKQIIYYILPKAWAWKKNRIDKVEKYCDIQISIFPFEKEYFKQSVYFGNPIMDEITQYNNNYKENTNISFLAGSRKTEIKFLMPVFREIAKTIKEKSILIIPPFFSDQEIATTYGDISLFTIERDTNNALIKSKFAFICSGTATLEASVIGTPFILVYKAKLFDYMVVSFLNIKYIGLANIILNKLENKSMHPEFFQKNINKNSLLECKNNYDYDRFNKGVEIIRDSLNKGCSKVIAGYLG